MLHRAAPSSTERHKPANAKGLRRQLQSGAARCRSLLRRNCPRRPRPVRRHAAERRPRRRERPRHVRIDHPEMVVHGDGPPVRQLPGRGRVVSIPTPARSQQLNDRRQSAELGRRQPPFEHSGTHQRRGMDSAMEPRVPTAPATSARSWCESVWGEIGGAAPRLTDADSWAVFGRVPVTRNSGARPMRARGPVCWSGPGSGPPDCCAHAQMRCGHSELSGAVFMPT
jgi:hypothetical protein